MKQIFMSHVEEDYYIVATIAEMLEAEGYTTWYYEEHSLPGPDYLVQVEKAINDAEAFLYVISLRSLGSHEVRKEVIQAHRRDKHFIPVLVDLTNNEFQQRQPELYYALGAATSVRIPENGIQAIIPRIIEGLKALGVMPLGLADNKAHPPSGQVTAEYKHGKSYIFNDDSKLVIDRFTFYVDSIILRAAKRRNLQHRSLISISDFLAGMIRKGNLTRHVLIAKAVDPDEFYNYLIDKTEPELADDKQQMREEERALIDEESETKALREALGVEIEEDANRWIVHEKEQLSPQLISLLEESAHNSEGGIEDVETLKVSEKDILKRMIMTNEWTELCYDGLPSAAEVSQIIQQCELAGEIDENGELVLDSLSPEAINIVRISHVISQKRGMFPIANRVLLAAFMLDREGYAARLCRTCGIRSEIIFAAMIAITENNEPTGFGLSMEACARIVKPVIDQAAQGQEEGDLIGEGELFKAFCEKADPDFKLLLKQPPLNMDLDKMKMIEPEIISPSRQHGDQSTSVSFTNTPPSFTHSDTGDRSQESSLAGNFGLQRELFEKTAWNIVADSAKIACMQGWEEVRTPHLFAAMLGDGSGTTGDCLRANGISTEIMRDIVASLLPAISMPPDDISTVVLGEHTRAIVERGIKLAIARENGKVSEEDLLKAFFADGGGVVGEVFKRLGKGIGV